MFDFFTLVKTIKIDLSENKKGNTEIKIILDKDYQFKIFPLLQKILKSLSLHIPKVLKLVFTKNSVCFPEKDYAPYEECAPVVMSRYVWSTITEKNKTFEITSPFVYGIGSVELGGGTPFSRNIPVDTMIHGFLRPNAIATLLTQ